MRLSKLLPLILVFLKAALPAEAADFVISLPTEPISFLPPTSTIPSSVTFSVGMMTKKVPILYQVGEGESPEEEAKHMKVPNKLFPQYRGFLADVLRRLPEIAMAMDNTTLTLTLTTLPYFSYGPTFERMANDCNITDTPTIENIGKVIQGTALTHEECNQYDFVVGHYYPYPSRAFRAPFTPPLLTTGATALQFVNRQSRQIATLQEASEKRAPVCVPVKHHYDTTTRFPNLLVVSCDTLDDCIAKLKREECALFAEDINQLRYKMVHDDELQLTREHYNEQFIAWPMNARLDPLLQQMLMRWIYQAKVQGILDELYDAYFNVLFCPAGKAGPNCNLTCNAATGASDRHGNCVCDSTKWTGEDCSIPVEEDHNLIPAPLQIVSYLMVAINILFMAGCLVWLARNKDTPQVNLAQPSFLCFVLLGCLISTLAIVAQQEDSGDGPVHACMIFPWLYSVGFCITFGTLFAKIRRIYKVFKGAASMQWVVVSAKETAMVVLGILSIDVLILIVWTCVDPLEWERTVLTMDKYGETLTSEGYCTSDHWRVFTGLIGAFHLLLLIIASTMCYIARHIDNVFCEGKTVAIAIVSNLQIFVVALPVLIIVGSDCATSFFVRSVVIWMNDLVVLVLIFGNLMWSVHYGRVDTEGAGRTRPIRELSHKTMIQFSMRNFKSSRTTRSSDAQTTAKFSSPLTASATSGAATARNSSLYSSGTTTTSSITANAMKRSEGDLSTVVSSSSSVAQRLSNGNTNFSDGPNTVTDQDTTARSVTDPDISSRSLANIVEESNIEEVSGDLALPPDETF